MIECFLDIEYESCEILDIPKIKGGKFSMSFNETCVIVPWVKKAKQNCVVSYHCFDNATDPIPSSVQCLQGTWNYEFMDIDPECKGIITLFIISIYYY